MFPTHSNWPLFRILTLFCMGMLIVTLLAPVADACPTCKEGIGHGSNNINMVRGYGWSIIFMMSAPFLIFSGISAYFYYEVRKARATSAQNPLVGLS